MTPRGRNSPLFTKSKLKIYLFCMWGSSMLPEAMVELESPASPLCWLPGASGDSLAALGSFPHNTWWPVLPWWVVVMRFRGNTLAYVLLIIDPICSLFLRLFKVPISFQSGCSLRAKIMPALFTLIFPVTRTVLSPVRSTKHFFDE